MTELRVSEKLRDSFVVVTKIGRAIFIQKLKTVEGKETKDLRCFLERIFRLLINLSLLFQPRGSRGW